LPDQVKKSLFERFPSIAEIAHGLGFEPDCFTNREARFLAALKEHEKSALLATVKALQQNRARGIDLDRNLS
jgi:hypothetical protein